MTTWLSCYQVVAKLWPSGNEMVIWNMKLSQTQKVKKGVWNSPRKTHSLEGLAAGISSCIQKMGFCFFCKCDSTCLSSEETSSQLKGGKPKHDDGLQDLHETCVMVKTISQVTWSWHQATSSHYIPPDMTTPCDKRRRQWRCWWLWWFRRWWTRRNSVKSYHNGRCWSVTFLNLKGHFLVCDYD